MLHGVLLILHLSLKTMSFLLQTKLRLEAGLLCVESDRDFLFCPLEVDFKLGDIVQLLFKLSELGFKVFFIVS